MSSVRRFEHARLRTPDLDVALAFYTEVMGLVVLDRIGETVYLGTGVDENFDLALTEGGTGVEHFAIRVDSDEELDRVAKQGMAGGMIPERRDGEGPGELRAVSFELASGHRMEFVTVGDHRYLEPYQPARPLPGGMGVLDADHINLCCNRVRGLAEQLREVFGFRFSDVIELPDAWLAAWTRLGDYHHDVAALHDDDPKHTLHHFAWTCPSVDHLVRCCDRLATFGIQLEIGIGRHPAGANAFAYFWDPGGNRTELSAEMALVGAASPPRIWDSPRDTFNVWGDLIVPESFGRGS